MRAIPYCNALTFTGLALSATAADPNRFRVASENESYDKAALAAVVATKKGSDVKFCGKLKVSDVGPSDAEPGTGKPHSVAFSAGSGAAGSSCTAPRPQWVDDNGIEGIPGYFLLEPSDECNVVSITVNNDETDVKTPLKSKDKQTRFNYKHAC